MTKIIVNNIDSATQTEFKQSITSNGSQQWFDSYGVIKSATTTTSSELYQPAQMQSASVLSQLDLQIRLQFRESGG